MLSTRTPTAFTFSAMPPLWRQGQRSVPAWLLALIASVLLAGAGSAQATEPVDLIEQRAFWEDTSAKANLDTARSQTHTPYQGIFSRGYSDSAQWIRLTIAPSAQPLGLLISPAWLDEITLYDPASEGAPITVGDRHVSRNSALPGLGHSFQLPPSAEP
jgi:hypothetical protein